MLIDVKYPAGIDEVENKGEVLVYPNPTTGKFTVANATGPSLHSRVNDIQVYDLCGRLVLSTEGPQADMSGFPAGLYVWQVGSARGKIVLE